MHGTTVEKMYCITFLKSYCGTWETQEIRMELCSILTLIGNGHQNMRETYQCPMYSRKLLMMGKEDARNM
jgi:hypothetical protein